MTNNNSGITALKSTPFISIASTIKKTIDAKINNILNRLVFLLLYTIFPIAPVFNVIFYIL